MSCIPVLMKYMHVVLLGCHPYIVSLEPPINGPPDTLLLPAAVYQITYTTPSDIAYLLYIAIYWAYWADELARLHFAIMMQLVLCAISLQEVSVQMYNLMHVLTETQRTLYTSRCT